MRQDLEGLDARLVNSIHDEFVVECREDLADDVSEKMRGAMTRAGERILEKMPVEVEVTVSRERTKEDVGVWASGPPRGRGGRGRGPRRAGVDEVGLRALGLGPPVVEAQAELALRSLAAREREVLDLLALGATNAEIAGELYISERTAKFHVRNIIGKLEVADRRQAVERATGFGLVGEG